MKQQSITVINTSCWGPQENTVGFDLFFPFFWIKKKDNEFKEYFLNSQFYYQKNHFKCITEHFHRVSSALPGAIVILKSHLISTTTPCVGNSITSCLINGQTEFWRCEITAQAHTACKRQSQDSSPSVLDSETHALSTVLCWLGGRDLTSTFYYTAMCAGISKKPWGKTWRKFPFCGVPVRTCRYASAFILTMIDR